MNKRQLLRDLFPFTEHLSDDELDQFVEELEGGDARHVTERWRWHAEDCELGYRANLEWTS